MKVPPSTICWQSAPFSSSEPSTQWMASGSVRATIFWIHFRRCLLLESGREGSRTGIVALRDEFLGSDIADCSSLITRLDMGGAPNHPQYSDRSFSQPQNAMRRGPFVFVQLVSPGPQGSVLDKF